MNDLELENGDLKIVNHDLTMCSGAIQVGQRAKIRLLTFLGEVFLNLDAGVPWLEEIIGVKPVNIDSVEATLRETLLADEEVEEIRSFEIGFANRVLTVNFTVSTVYGITSGSVAREVG